MAKHRPPPTDDDTPRMPARIGRYAIQRVLGSGGMATVYAAQQEQPKRTVALKVMRPGIASRNTERRFRHEMEILAKLRHPFIAQIFDAGTHDDGGGGVPYFVMEYIPQAQTLTDFADARKLDLRDRLKLFVKVCAAVQHGHAARIVHRDLKPGNILVDAKGDPKIIDFGVARVTEMDFGSQTQHTEAGRLVGTVAYMSPEQIAASGADIGPATDVYALGVTLFRLLCGRMPHSLTGLPLHEAVRVVREDQPIRPSSIRPELRGDLETIVMMSLEKDPARRYRTAGDLGRDLLRFLADQPIRARPASTFHRVRLFARRHRTAVFAASVMGCAILILAIGGGWLWWQYREINRQWAQIEQEGREQARQRRDEIAEVPTDLAMPRLRTFLRGHRAAVTDLAFSADGATAATIDAAGAINVWDLPGGRRRQSVLADEARSGCLAIAADGALIAVGRRDGVVTLFDGADGQLLRTRSVHSGHVSSVAIRDGWIASGSTDMTVRLWRADESDESAVALLRGSDGPFESIAFTADGRALVAGTQSGRLNVFDLRRRERTASAPIGRSLVRRIATDGTGRFVALGLEGGELQLTEIDDDGRIQPRWRVQAHDSTVVGVSIHPGGRTIATGSPDGMVRIWSAEGGRLVAAWSSERMGLDAEADPRSMPVWSTSFTPDGAWLAIGAEDGLVTLLPVDRVTGELES